MDAIETSVVRSVPPRFAPAIKSVNRCLPAKQRLVWCDADARPAYGHYLDSSVPFCEILCLV